MRVEIRSGKDRLRTAVRIVQGRRRGRATATVGRRSWRILSTIIPWMGIPASERSQHNENYGAQRHAIDRSI